MKIAPLACALDAAPQPVRLADAAGNDDLPASLTPCQPHQAGSRP